ncbi:hypothetical protein BCR34DRAFT_604714 [Clohesyomyces aquaticus]|uniref:Uncharacterized protein n=1 Tax=Clohesyomyces aquaticus TaxID=1231657 RepID=A0A1Y1Z3N5_9PLEO|nr:hypothetical protein BCR34DRAFT_604714 [Clohesyomyces aquaticus]
MHDKTTNPSLTELSNRVAILENQVTKCRLSKSPNVKAIPLTPLSAIMFFLYYFTWQRSGTIDKDDIRQAGLIFGRVLVLPGAWLIIGVTILDPPVPSRY